MFRTHVSVLRSLRHWQPLPSCHTTAAAAISAFLFEPTCSVWTEAPSRDDSPSFYDMTVEEYAKKPLTQLSLHQLLASGRGAWFDSNKVLESAAFTWEELPKRLARRLLDLQLLPFIVVTNPHIKKVYEAYWHAFNTLRLAPVPTDAASNDRFSALLRRLVDEHSPMLDALAAGLREVRRKPLVGAHLRMDAFLEAMLRSRISRRVLAEQHINLTHHRPGYIGVINLDLSLADSVDFAAGRCRQVCLEHFGAAPEFIISGDVSLRAPYIPAHLDYMLYEIMKNAARAVVERHMSRVFSNDSRGSGGSSALSPSPSPSSYGWSDGAGRSLPPVHVRICGGEDDIAIRISDQGGGIPVAHIDKVWEFGWTDLDPGVLIETSDTDAQREGLGLDTTPGGGAGGLGVFQAHVGGSSAGGFGKYRMAGLGFGLPLSRLYARYFGGDLKLVSLPGYGVDAFLQLKGLVAEHREWKEEDGHKEVEAIAGTASQDNGLRSTLDSMNQNI